MSVPAREDLIQSLTGYPQDPGPMQNDTRFRVYVDGEVEPSLDYDLFMFHGIGFNGDQTSGFSPWGTRRAGHTAFGGGLYNTFRIPYSTSIKVTATSPHRGYIWYIIRGVENYPLVMGDLQLPSNTRLRLYKKVSALEPYEFVTLAEVPSSTGALFMLVVAANNSQSDPHYLEACFRAVIDDQPTSFLASGTEDFFLSAFYYGGGPYHLENSGVTFLSDSSSTVSAYKYFENDPILFNSSLLLQWRAGETPDGVEGCPTDFPAPQPGSERVSYRIGPPVGTTYVSTYALVYEWKW